MIHSNPKRNFLQLDPSLVTFEMQCHMNDDLLMSENLLLRVSELRKKFCYVIKKVPKGKNAITKEQSACVEERFNGFQLVERLGKKERRHFYRPTDIVYKPVSKIN